MSYILSTSTDVSKSQFVKGYLALKILFLTRTRDQKARFLDIPKSRKGRSKRSISVETEHFNLSLLPNTLQLASVSQNDTSKDVSKYPPAPIKRRDRRYHEGAMLLSILVAHKRRSSSRRSSRNVRKVESMKSYNLPRKSTNRRTKRKMTRILRVSCSRGELIRVENARTGIRERISARCWSW